MEIGITEDDLAPTLSGCRGQGIANQLLKGFASTEAPRGQGRRGLCWCIGLIVGHLNLQGRSQAQSLQRYKRNRSRQQPAIKLRQFSYGNH